jgi:hypothetical protein
VYTRQDRVDRVHPECEGHCKFRMCQPAIPVGGECKSAIECGPSRRCKEGKCVDGPLPELGAACPDRVCATGARCIDGTCTRGRVEGEPCGSDGECIGRCDREDGGPGKCVRSCTAVLPTFGAEAKASPSASARGPETKPPPRPKATGAVNAP